MYLIEISLPILQENINSTSEKEKIWALVNMGYTMEEASIAIERCGITLVIYICIMLILGCF